MRHCSLQIVYSGLTNLTSVTNFRTRIILSFLILSFPPQCRLRIDYAELTFHQLIGKGMFKAVYRGRWNNTSVAIVSMRRGGAVTEARLLQRMSNHPNLVQVDGCW